MADQPRAAELTSDFLDAVQVKGGLRIDRRNLSVWSVLGAGLSQMAIRTNLVATKTYDDAILFRSFGASLDQYCADRGPVRRFSAKAAFGPMTFARPTFSAGGGTIYKGTEIRVPYNGKSYVFTVAADTSVSSVALSVPVPVVAQAAGAAANVGTVSSALALTGLPAALFDTTLVPTSVTVAGGVEEEDDLSLQTRQSFYEQGKRGGVVAAVIYGALAVNGVRRVVTAMMRDPHIGVFCAVYIGDLNWQSTQDLRDQVAASLEDWRAWGASMDVRGMAQSDVTVQAMLRMVQPVAFYDVTALRSAGVQSVLDFFDRRRDPYAYDLAMLQGRLARVHDDVATVELSLPGASVTSPISPSSLKAAGALPTTLTRYRTKTSLITVDVGGPT